MNDPVAMHTADGRFLGYFPQDVSAEELADAEAHLARADEKNIEFLRRSGRLFNL